MKSLLFGAAVLAAVVLVAPPHTVRAQMQGPQQTEKSMGGEMQKMHRDMHGKGGGKMDGRRAEMKERHQEKTRSCNDYAWESQGMKDCFARQQEHGRDRSGTRKGS
jgi:hypothetical protein